MRQRAILHFREDLARAEALVDLAEKLPDGTSQQRLVRDDVLRSAWMFAVGAMDAYFSDAYADMLAASLLCLRRQPKRKNGEPVEVPRAIQDTLLPASMFLKSYPERDNWEWRMAARARIERQNFLSFANEIQKLINSFLPKHRGLLAAETMGPWIEMSGNRKRLLGATQREYRRMSPQEKKDARKRARDCVLARMQEIVQRRHDCIHNCDRPKFAPQLINSPGTVRTVLDHVGFVVERCDEHIDREFPQFLKNCGFTGTTIAQAK